MAQRTYYDITPSQELSFLNRQWTLHKAILNIATSVTVHASLDRRLLEGAVRQCILRWDALGLRFVKQGKVYRQYFGDRGCLYLEHRDFAGAAEQEEFFAKLASRPMPIVDSPQAGFVIFTTPEGHTGIFSVFSHLVMDSWAISMFYRDVIEVYWALVNNEPLPKPPRDYEPVLAAELAYQGSQRFLADRAFWERETAVSQPIFTSLKGSSVLAAYRRLTRQPNARQCWVQHLRTKADHVVLTVSPGDVAAFQAFLDVNRLPSMQILFVLALRTYLSRVNDREPDVRLRLSIARRATLAEKNSGGSRVHAINIRTILAEETTFAEALDVLMDNQNAAFRHSDFGGLEAVTLVHRFFAEQGSINGTDYADVMFTFQPVPMTVGHGLSCTTNWHCNGSFSLGSYLTIMDDDGSGGLRCYWERQVHYLPVEVIRDCHDFMVRAIRAGIERPSITLGELMDL